MSQHTEQAQRHFLPNFCKLESVLYILLMAQILAITLALNTHLNQAGFWAPLGAYGLFILWVTLSSAAFLCALKKQTARLSPSLAGLFAFFIINSNTLLITWLAAHLLPFLNLLTTPATNHYLNNLAISCIVSGLILRYLYVMHAWRLQTKAESEAKLDALQARMRPHFLFNCLNTIANLTREDPLLAETLTEDLAALFRASMQASTRMVPFEQELTLTQQYLNIEKTRLGDRLNIEWRVSDIPVDALLPPISLQPLVENAVYHSIELSQHNSTLAISGVLDGNMISLSVQNPLLNIETERAGSHIAIENLKLRLQSCFPNRSTFTFSSSAGIVTTRIQFPYQTTQS